MSAPTPWRIKHIHGTPIVVDARGYTVISSVNAIEGEVAEQVMRVIVDGVNEAAARAAGPDLAALARVVVAEDKAGTITSTRRHMASALLADALSLRRCETCGNTVPDDVLPAERVDGAIELRCGRCSRAVVEGRVARFPERLPVS